MWHLALPFGEYFRKFWYPHLQWFQRSTDNCGKLHVRIILGHPIDGVVGHQTSASLLMVHDKDETSTRLYMTVGVWVS